MYFPAIAENQNTVALEPGNKEAQSNRAVQLDNVGLVSLAMKPLELFCKFAPAAFPRQQKRSCDSYQQLFGEAKRSQRRFGSR
jgi:hypothetical protein